MDNAELEKAKSLKLKIEATLRSLEDINKMSEKGADNQSHCKVFVYNDKFSIDYEVFEVALILQERRDKNELARLEKEFKAL